MATLQIDVRELELFLKRTQQGPEALQALRIRTAVHYLDPTLDRLSNRMLQAYAKLCEIVKPPFSILDAGCMAGYLRHFMQLRIKNFTYVGIDCWDEALTVAREFQPDIDVRKCNLLEDELPNGVSLQGRPETGFDYVWCSNINWGKHAEKAVEKLKPLARRACFFAQPPDTGDFPGDTIDCGETTLYVMKNEPSLLLRPDDRYWNLAKAR